MCEDQADKTFVKMMDELGYDVEMTYKKKQPTKAAENRNLWRPLAWEKIYLK